MKNHHQEPKEGAVGYQTPCQASCDENVMGRTSLSLLAGAPYSAFTRASSDCAASSGTCLPCASSSAAVLRRFSTKGVMPDQAPPPRARQNFSRASLPTGYLVTAGPSCCVAPNTTERIRRWNSPPRHCRVDARPESLEAHKDASAPEPAHSYAVLTRRQMRQTI